MYRQLAVHNTPLHTSSFFDEVPRRPTFVEDTAYICRRHCNQLMSRPHGRLRVLDRWTKSLAKMALAHVAGKYRVPCKFEFLKFASSYPFPTEREYSDSIKQRVKGGEEDNVSPTGLPQVKATLQFLSTSTEPSTTRLDRHSRERKYLS